MSPRPYRSAVRDEAAEKTRARVVAAAVKILVSRKGAAGFSLEAVAKAARVTRLTVYNQFGSRRALLEAVFDDRAQQGGLHRIAAAMSDPDPKSALRRLIRIFCEFWSCNDISIARLQAAGAIDSEFEEGVRARNERRRDLLAVIVGRIVGIERAKNRHARDLVDILFALTSFSFFREIRAHRTGEGASAMIERLAFDALQQTMGGTGDGR